MVTTQWLPSLVPRLLFVECAQKKIQSGNETSGFHESAYYHTTSYACMRRACIPAYRHR